jgi:oxaloacetate decarboxylase alpha subunit/pyruvate carboxylase subunit B
MNSKILAPMPGMIIRYEKNINDTVKAGETVIILEAMKMENAIQSPADGIIRSVNFKSGDTVKKDDVLCIIENEK